LNKVKNSLHFPWPAKQPAGRIATPIAIEAPEEALQKRNPIH